MWREQNFGCILKGCLLIKLTMHRMLYIVSLLLLDLFVFSDSHRFLCYTMTLSASPYDDGMTDECWTGKNLEGRGHDLIKVLSQHFPGGIEETHGNLSQDSRCPAENLTENPSNTSLELYIRTNQFGSRFSVWFCVSDGSKWPLMDCTFRDPLSSLAAWGTHRALASVRTSLQ
jgi:hypothetical protein